MSSSLSTMNVRVVGFNVNDVILQLIVAVVKRHRCWSWLVWMTLARTNSPTYSLQNFYFHLEDTEFWIHLPESSKIIY